jgi:hypothetical protein
VAFRPDLESVVGRMLSLLLQILQQIVLLVIWGLKLIQLLLIVRSGSELLCNKCREEYCRLMNLLKLLLLVL